MNYWFIGISQLGVEGGHHPGVSVGFGILREGHYVPHLAGNVESIFPENLSYLDSTFKPIKGILEHARYPWSHSNLIGETIPKTPRVRRG